MRLAIYTSVLVTAVFSVYAAVEIWLVTDGVRHGISTAVGLDANQYLGHTRRWLAGGPLYLPAQTTGPYVVESLSGNVYPPTLMYLTVPFALGAPMVLWYALPIGVVIFTYWRRRPAWWAWPLIGFVLAYPRTYTMILLGNPGMWAVAAAVAGTAWGWASWGASVKLTFLPLALVGLRAPRQWLLGALGAGALGLPFGTLWLDYATAIRNTASIRGFEYVLGEWPIAIALVLAALSAGSRRRRDTPVSQQSPSFSR